MYPYFESDKKLVKCYPSARQIAVQQMEFYSFVHFGMNTFSGREWGEGKEDPMLFNPAALDAGQWVDALKSAGIAGLILTCKHHDGFCLWPSQYTAHSIKYSAYKNGQGDIVREVSDACKKGNIKFGVYLSPWDRNSQYYGDSEKYNDYFCNQLTELCTNYGELFTVWFDGACGEGPNGKRQVYDFDRYYALIRKLQPNACISICGPDIRWCGNEAGDTRESEWSVIPTAFISNKAVMENSQQSDDTGFREKKLDAMQQDLGSRSFVEGAAGFHWHPAEVDTSIRPGWFYHVEEDSRVRSFDELIHIWYRSVGGNCTLLLNIPPDKRGLFADPDVARLKEIGDYIKRTFAQNLAENAVFSASSDNGYDLAENAKTDSYDTYYKPFDGENAITFTVKFNSAVNASHVVLKENIRLGQRIESYVIYAKTGEGYREISRGTTVGYKRIAKFENVVTDEIRIDITDSRVCPTLSFVGVY